MPRRDDVLLRELLECAARVEEYLQRGGSAWFEDQAIADAVLLRLMRIGEIARVVSDDVQARHPHIPWGRLRGFRNVAVHEYFRLEMALVRSVAETEVPRLRPQVAMVLRWEFPDVAERDEHERG